MKTFRVKILFLFLQILAICVLASCIKSKRITDNFSEIVRFKYSFYYIITEKTASYKELIDSSNILLWHHSIQLKKKAVEKTLITDSKYISIRKNFSTEAINNMLLLRMCRGTSFIAYLNGKEIASYDQNLIRNNNPAFSKAKGSIAIYNSKSPQNFFIPGDKIAGLLKNTDNELLVRILREDITMVDFADISLYTCIAESEKSVFIHHPNYGQDTVFTQSELPIVFIQTKGQIIRDEPKIKATMGIVNNRFRKNRVGDTCRYFYGNIGIELRGQTSKLAPKKSYGVKTFNSSWAKQDFSLFGMPAGTDWILYGPYIDKSLIRDALVYRLSNSLGRYSARTQYVELVINNDYRGVYVFMEHIEQGKKRVDISSVTNKNACGDTISGGYIFKIDKGERGYFWRSSYPLEDSIAQKQFFHIYYPKKMNYTQKIYVRNTLARFEETLYTRYNSNEIFGLIDDSSFIDYFIINELVRNIDAYRLSTYFYKDCDSKDPRLHMGPVWDFNYSLGLTYYNDGYKPEGWVYSHMKQVPFWWKYLLMNEAFKKKLINRWETLRKNELSTENMMLMIDDEVNKIGSTEGRNFIKWPIIGKGIQPNYSVLESYDEEITYIKTWLIKRIEWMDDNIRKL